MNSNVFLAAIQNQLEKVVWASSETTLGLDFEKEPPWYAPMDEDHYPRPTTTYSLSKVVGETEASHLVSNGVLVDPCEPNGCANDGYSFKGIFVRDLGEFARATGTTAYNAFLARQASSIQASDTNGDGQSGLYWAGPLADLGYPNQQSAADAFTAALGT